MSLPESPSARSEVGNYLHELRGCDRGASGSATALLSNPRTMRPRARSPNGRGVTSARRSRSVDDSRHSRRRANLATPYDMRDTRHGLLHSSAIPAKCLGMLGGRTRSGITSRHNDLREGAGKKGPLTAKGYFRRCPHLLALSSAPSRRTAALWHRSGILKSAPSEGINHRVLHRTPVEEGAMPVLINTV